MGCLGNFDVHCWREICGLRDLCFFLQVHFVIKTEESLDFWKKECHPTYVIEWKQHQITKLPIRRNVSNVIKSNLENKPSKQGAENAPAAVHTTFLSGLRTGRNIQQFLVLAIRSPFLAWKYSLAQFHESTFRCRRFRCEFFWLHAPLVDGWWYYIAYLIFTRDGKTKCQCWRNITYNNW